MSGHGPERLFHFVSMRDPSVKTKGGLDSMRLSQARSHAARITHMRKRKKVRTAKEDKSIDDAQDGTTGELDVATKYENYGTDYSPSPLSLLGQHKVDPFESYPTGPLPAYLRRCLEYGELYAQYAQYAREGESLHNPVYECVHPTLITSTRESGVALIKTSWRRIGLEWPLMYHLQVAGAANLVRADARNPQLPNSIEILRLKHQSQGLALLMSALQNLQGPASDALLMAMVMAGMLTDPTPSQVPELYRASPLATTQHLHVYARLTMVPATMRTMLESVDKRGGIQTIRDYGMVSILQLSVHPLSHSVFPLTGDLLCSADLLASSRLGIPPAFPWLYPNATRLCTRQHNLDETAMDMLTVLGTGFHNIRFIERDLADALEAAEDVTVALDLFRRRKAHAFNLNDIVDVANEAQHKLLVIKPTCSLETNQMDCVREICRRAALIYNDMVIFPLPATTENKPRLSNALRLAIENYEAFRSKYLSTTDGVVKAIDYSGLILWALMLGAMAATLTVNSTWYAQKLGRYLSQSPYRHTWSDFRRLMSTYLWWGYIFDDPGQRLWWEGQTFVSDAHYPLDLEVHESDDDFGPEDQSR